MPHGHILVYMPPSSRPLEISVEAFPSSSSGRADALLFQSLHLNPQISIKCFFCFTMFLSPCLSLSLICSVTFVWCPPNFFIYRISASPPPSPKSISIFSTTLPWGGWTDSRYHPRYDRGKTFRRKRVLFDGTPWHSKKPNECHYNFRT